MKAINAKYRTTFVFSTHDDRVIAEADRLVRIEDGMIVGLGVRRGPKWVMVKPDAFAVGDETAPAAADERIPSQGSDRQSTGQRP